MGLSKHRLPSQSLTTLLSSQRTLTPISTSIQTLNESLNGGIIPGQIYEISGLNNSGRRQFALQVCHRATELNKKVVWISCLGLLKVEGVQSISVSSITKLFLFLQCHLSKENYGLIVIEDMSVLLQKQLNDLKIESSKSNNKRNKFLKIILKNLQAHCNQFKSAILISNPVESMNMQFVESNPRVSNTQQSQSLISSQRPKVHHQQILKSGLGDHPSWSSFIRARLTFYKDWHGQTPVNYIHLKHNPLLVKKFLKYNESCLIPRIYQFKVNTNGDGIQEVDKPHDPGIVTADHSFILNDEDLASSDIDSEEEVPEPSSSIPKNIQTVTVKEIVQNPQTLSSLITNTVTTRSFEIFSRDMQPDFSTSTVEIEDELEELYPTQPESLSIIQLSQLDDKENEQPQKKLRLMGLDQEEIPSSVPYF